MDNRRKHNLLIDDKNDMRNGRATILFDIDGTLLSTYVGRSTLESAIAELFSISSPNCDVEFSGRTDRSIVSEILRLNRIEVNESTFRALRDQYLSALPEAIQLCRGILYPGVRELLTILKQQHPYVALVAMTGNFEEAAWVKLNHFELGGFFEMVIGGENDHHRNELANRAVSEVKGLWCRERITNSDFLPEVEKEGWVTENQSHDIQDEREATCGRLVVIGDTPADIQCAKAIGAKSVAVLTGGCDADELYREGPDHMFVDLSDSDKVISALLD